ncbi:DNA methylase N-4/N-6 domain protein [Gloeothece citriformis PCC 7424]|uniref:DNA methylase N-4/N-6 domain protein n=1 Tax=Gloeothece citriformis (strain PCC 7424) TaxID=65393 RepID=B7K6X2_GLOC7|nr:DNA methyltransferase [Gloeothece citriformis]ACK72671.1 DNA methylase N-4/N-6 domain protein [Gloeothece citriformis PCC 7424]
MKLNRLPFYETQWGAAYLGDSLKVLSQIPDESIDLICTSPPFALVRKKEYGNVDADEYVQWFDSFAQQFYRILKQNGSLVIDIGGSWIKGYPVRSLYHFELVMHLCKPRREGGLGFYLAQELYWYNPAKLPTPAEWVTVRRERVKDAVNTIWWLSKDPHPKACNKRVLRPYSKAMENLLKNGYDAKLRPSGHDISTKFQRNRGGAIPPNIIDAQTTSVATAIGSPVLASFDWLLFNDLAQPVNVISASNTASNDYYQRRCKEEGIKPHPARFPQALPEFIINLCTEPGDLVLDPFCGSNVTGRVAEDLKRYWLAIEIDQGYLKASQYRFETEASSLVIPLETPQNCSSKNLSLIKEKILSDNQLLLKEKIAVNQSNEPKQLTLPFLEQINKMKTRQLKFTYGHQFEPEKFSLAEIMKLCQDCEPNRRYLQQEIANRYFAQHSQQSKSQTAKTSNIDKLAMNCFLSLRAYGLVEKTEDDWTYKVTEIAQNILDKQNNPEESNKLLARHILTNLTGMSLLKAIEAINARNEQPKLELIGYELQEMGFSISPNAIYVSTMRSWLSLAGVFEREYEINWDVVADILGINKDYIDELYTLTPEQKYFLLSMIHLDIRDFEPWNKISNYGRSVYKVKFTSKSFVKDIIQPLVNVGLIETEKSTGGRGAKPNQVKLTQKARNELVKRLIETIADQTQLSETELNRTFEDVINDLDHPDKHVKGKALELLAIWMIRLTSLRFTKWRKRDYETGNGEVDVLAGSDRFVYSRWQIQCKNTKKVDVEVLAKEIGMTFVTGADVVMIVTTGEFTKDAFQYAYRMMEVSRYYMILLQKEDLELIKQNKTNIITILDKKARRVFAKKELGMTQIQIDEIESEEETLED